MEEVQLHDKRFRRSISSEEVIQSIDKLAHNINSKEKDKQPVFLAVLNGSFMFASDLMKRIEGICEITFVKMASYQGTTSTGQVKTLLGLDINIRDRTVIVIEDIVDTGNTIERLIDQLKIYSPKEIKVATLLFKPNVYKKNIHLDYVGIEIPDEFIVGYGLDYDGLGRNLKDIYTLVL